MIEPVVFWEKEFKINKINSFSSIYSEFPQRVEGIQKSYFKPTSLMNFDFSKQPTSLLSYKYRLVRINHSNTTALVKKQSRIWTPNRCGHGNGIISVRLLFVKIRGFV